MKKAGRLNKEMNDLNKAPLDGVTIALTNDDLTQWHVTILGPEGSPFLGGKFLVHLDFSDSYPFKPPKIKFLTKIYHPNVKTDTGEICTQAIEKQWVPTLNAKFVIEAILSVIKNPTLDNALEPEIGQQFSSNYNTFAATAAEWVLLYA